MTRFPVAFLRRRLSAQERRTLGSYLRRLLVWQHDLVAWPKPPPARRAVPFVSLYAPGGLRGCKGTGEGPPEQRVAEAFLAARHDRRFPPPGNR